MSRSEELLLLSSDEKSEGSAGKKRVHFLTASLLKWLIKFTMWAFFIMWIAVIFLYPLQSSESLVQKWTHATSASFLGFTGSGLVLFSGPIIVISTLSAVYLALNSNQEDLHLKNGTEKEAGYRLWTFPAIVRGPFGVVSAAEMIGIMVFGVYVIWVAAVYTLQKLTHVFGNPEYTTPQQKWSELLRLSGKGCGVAGIFCLSFMLIPIGRGSCLLRLLNIPSQHAIRYHIWLSHLSMSLFTCHAFLYLIGWYLIGGIPSKLVLWQSTEEAHLPGIITILIGWTIWITSFGFVRSNNFELFCYTHHLYFIFFLFLAMHIGLKHNALSYIFLRIKEISLLQWHPFSVSTTSLDGKNRLSILVRACGNWTSKLKENALNSSQLIASVEGPYGYELSDHLRYKYLILVAGGIGISPFIGVLSDVIHRMKLGKPCLPRKILLVWAMKTSDKLSLISTIDMESVRSIPFYDLQCLQILIYVTQEIIKPPLENDVFHKPIVSYDYSTSIRNFIPILTSSGHKLWFATYQICSTIGLILTISIINLFYIRPFEITNWWFQALLLLACMMISVVLFGGGVVGLWHISEKKIHVKGFEEQSCEYTQDNISFFEHFASSTTFHYALRPNFKEILGSISKLWGHVDVGVTVCGPETLEKSVATECRSLNFTRNFDEPIFHFNTHSFSF